MKKLLTKKQTNEKPDYKARTAKTVIALMLVAFLVNKYDQEVQNKAYREKMQSFCDEFLNGDILEVPNSIGVEPYEKVLVTGKIIREYMELYDIELVSLGDNIITLDGRDIIRVKRMIGDHLVTSYYSKGDYFDKFGIRSVDYIESVPVEAVEEYNLEVSYHQLQNIINLFMVSEDESKSLELKHN